MQNIASWLADKGLALDEAAVETALRIKDPAALLSSKLEEDLASLDRATGFPYRLALTCGRRGDLGRVIDCLLPRITAQPLHLPLRRLHAQLLCLEQRYSEALESYWKILDAFSYREDLVPPLLYRAFLEKAAFAAVRPAEAPPLELRLSFPEFFPRSVWCSPGGLAVEWTAHWQVLFAEWDSLVVSAHAWDGRRVFESDSGRRTSLAMVTGKYVVYRKGEEAFRILDLASGRELPESPLSESLFRALFLPRDRELASTDLYRLAFWGRERLAAGEAGFSNVAFRLGRYEEGEEMEPTGTFHTGGTIEGVPRPLPTPRVLELEEVEVSPMLLYC